ncbi:MAG: hypothetical protein N2317_08765 [Syntrophales bacterium]|nr:hypothetical protein [Syntrophales bacterium]
MKRINIQIYEVQDVKEAEALIALGVDRIGSVILDKRSWSNSGIKDVVELTKGARSKSVVLPLFRDLYVICSIIEELNPDFIHFCETLSPFPGDSDYDLSFVKYLAEFQISLKERYPEVGIVRTIGVPNDCGVWRDKVLEKLSQYIDIFAPASDELMIDTYLGNPVAAVEQPVPGFLGITGVTSDWSVAVQVVVKSPIPVVLAGGLGPENVYEAIRVVRPFGVDSCSGTNARDSDGRPVRFRKDMERVRRFLEEARRAAEEFL